MKAAIYIVNAIIVLGIFLMGFDSNDKFYIISYSLYVVLFAMNVMLGLFRQMDNKPIFKHYYLAAGILGLVGIILMIIN